MSRAPRRPTPVAPRPVPVTGNVTPITAAPPRKRMNRSLLGESKSRGSRRRSPSAPPFAPFSLPEFPPSVTLKTIAQDSAISSISAWATTQWIDSSFSEGMQFLGYTYLALLAQRPEYRVASEEVASEMTREWIDIHRAGEEEKSDNVKELEDEIKRLKLQDVCLQAVEHDGFFGRGHIYIDTGDTDDRDELKTSIGDGDDGKSATKVSRKKPVIGLRNVEPLWTYPNQYNSTDPLRADWYRPGTWVVQNKEVHRTRLLTIIGRPVPDMLKPAYSFGGLAMSQMMKPYVDNWLRARQSVSDIMHAFTVWVLKTQLGVLAQDAGTDVLDRLELFNNLRDNNGAMVIDKESEEWANVSASLASLDQLQAQAQEQMASVTRIPLVKLLGISPHGLNASTEGELRAFYDWIHAFQERILRPVITVVLRFVQLSLWDKVDKDIDFTFRPLWQLDEQGKATHEKTVADTHAVYMQEGVVSPDEVRATVAKDQDSPYHGLDLEGPAPGPPGGAAGPEDGLMPPNEEGMLDGPPPDDETMQEDEDLGTWSRKAKALFEDAGELDYWTRRAEEVFPEAASVGKWAALAAKLARTNNRAEPLDLWVSRVDRVRWSWADRAASIPRNVVREPPATSWKSEVWRQFGGDPTNSDAEPVRLRPARESQADVLYEFPAAGSDHCGDCVHFREPKQCDLVSGLIEPEGWCVLFDAADDHADAGEVAAWSDRAAEMLATDDWDEGKHHRGQPENKGQFGSGGGGGGVSKNAGSVRTKSIKTRTAKPAQLSQEHADQIVSDVVADMGYDRKVEVSDKIKRIKTGEVGGGRTLKGTSRPDGSIVIYRRAIPPEQHVLLPGIVAHEIQHQRNDTAMRNYRWMQHRGTKLAEFIDPDTLHTMEDGGRDISSYAAEYWDAVAGTEGTSRHWALKIAVDETLAEMSFVKQMTGELPGNERWKTLYALINRSHDEGKIL